MLLLGFIIVSSLSVSAMPSKIENFENYHVTRIISIRSAKRQTATMQNLTPLVWFAVKYEKSLNIFLQKNDKKSDFEGTITKFNYYYKRYFVKLLI